MSILSDKLKAKRKEKGFSQKTLSEGICEQSQISKIERGNYMPAADLLYKLANRLQVPLDYFFDEQIEMTSNIAPFKKLAEKLLEDRNYEDLEYLLNLEKEKYQYLSTEDEFYLLWIQAIILFYLHGSKDEAIASLENALPKLSVSSSVYLKLLNTLSNFYFSVGRDAEYEENNSLLISLYQEKDLNHQDYLFGYIRVKHNFAYYLHSKGKELEAVQEALETIDFCKQKETSYQLAPLLTIVANAGKDFLKHDEILDYYLQARDICKIYEHKLMMAKIDHFLKDKDR